MFNFTAQFGPLVREFNSLTFKSFILTTITALGLAVNIQACPNPTIILLSQKFGPVTKDQIEALRSQTDSIAQELTHVIDQDSNFDLVITKITTAGNLAQEFLDALLALGKNKTCKIFFTQSTTIHLFHRLQKEIESLATSIDTIFPANKTPICSCFFGNLAARYIPYITTALSKTLQMGAESDKLMEMNTQELHALKKLFRVIEQTCCKTFTFHKKHTEELKALVHAAAAVIKDDQFFQELYTNFPLRTPNAWFGTDSLAAFIGVAEETFETSSLPSVKNLQNMIQAYGAKFIQELGADIKKIETTYNQESQALRETPGDNAATAQGTSLHTEDDNDENDFWDSQAMSSARRHMRYKRK